MSDLCMTKNVFKVFNQRIAGYLMYNGLKLLSIEPNPNISKFNVFIFEKSEQLTKLLNNYQKQNQEGEI